jgi:hypothetical protein
MEKETWIVILVISTICAAYLYYKLQREYTQLKKEYDLYIDAWAEMYYEIYDTKYTYKNKILTALPIMKEKYNNIWGKE